MTALVGLGLAAGVACAALSLLVIEVWSMASCSADDDPSCEFD